MKNENQPAAAWQNRLFSFYRCFFPVAIVENNSIKHSSTRAQDSLNLTVHCVPAIQIDDENECLPIRKLKIKIKKIQK